MLATPRTNVAALDPEATRLNRTTAQQVVDAAEARRLDLARVHEKASMRHPRRDRQRAAKACYFLLM